MSTVLTPAYLSGLNDAQREAVLSPWDAPLQVLAGAGTGKTEVIARRYARIFSDLKASGEPHPEAHILVATFTEDAAAEMRLRIARCLDPDDAEAVTGPGSWIGTFHAMATRLLRTHAEAVGLPADFSVLNTLNQKVLFNRLLSDVLAGLYGELDETLARHHLTGLAPDILSTQAVLRASEALPDTSVQALLSGERLYPLISRIKAAGWTPADFLARATAQADALHDRLKTLPVPHDPDLAPIENMQLKLDAWRAALGAWAHPDWNPVRAVEAKKLEPTAGDYYRGVEFIARHYLENRRGKAGYVPITPDFSDLDAINGVEHQLIQWVAALYALYQDTLRGLGTCDFDDLINYAVRLLEADPAVAARYRGQFAAIIVDEFQDSNGAQLRLLECLMTPAHPNITVVGDEKQSIYGFRFAQPENMRLLFRNVPAEKLHIARLSINYRSRPPVLEAANGQATRIVGDASQALLPAPLAAGAHEAAPVVWWQTDGVDEAGKPIAMDGQRTREAAMIAAEIRRLTDAGECAYGDVAVLVRSHRKAEMLQRVLAEAGIPAVRSKNLGFFAEPVIKNAMALLALMHNPADDGALMRLLQNRLNARQIRLMMLHKRHQKQMSLLDACRAPEGSGLEPPVCAAVHDLADRLLSVRKRVGFDSPMRLFSALRVQIDVMPPCNLSGLPPAVFEETQRDSLCVFESLLALFSAPQPVQPTLTEVLETLDRYAADTSAEWMRDLPAPSAREGHGDAERPDAVRLMTVFAAKGLEFPVVFAAWTDSATRARGSDDALLAFDPQYAGKPGFGLILGKHADESTPKKAFYRQAWQVPQMEAEAGRLLYVALTRARERLYVVQSQSPG